MENIEEISDFTDKLIFFSNYCYISYVGSDYFIPPAYNWLNKVQ